MVQKTFEALGRLFYIRQQIRDLEYRVNTAGINYSAEEFGGLMVVFTILGGVLLTLLLITNTSIMVSAQSLIKGFPIPVLDIILVIISFIISYLAVMVIATSLLTLRSDARRNNLEEVLPDFLLLVSANIKAGMPLDQAMYQSAKSDYGLMAIEVRDIIKRSFSGESLEMSLDLLASRFDSRVFKRTILLLKQASATGGEVAKVLERTSQDVRSTNLIKKEVSASLILYEIFILFASMGGTPFLFAVSGKLIDIFEKAPIASSIPQGGSAFGGQLGGLRFTGSVISSTEFFYFTMAGIFITSLFSSLIVGIIRKGTKNEGIKYFPFVLGISYVIFVIVNSLLGLLFTTII